MERNSTGAYTHSASSRESASTPISEGGWKYNPENPQDVADFADADVAELEQYERDRPGLDFSTHPAMVARDAEV